MNALLITKKYILAFLSQVSDNSLQYYQIVIFHHSMGERHVVASAEWKNRAQ